MRDELQISEEHGRFNILYILARTGEEPHQFYVHDDTGRLLCFLDRSLAKWFCEMTSEYGLEEAKKQVAANFQTQYVPRPDDIKKKLAKLYGVPEEQTPSDSIE